MDMPRDDGTTLRQDMELIEKQFGKRNPKLDEDQGVPLGTEYIFDLFFNINRTRTIEQPLSYAMLCEYSLLNGWSYECFEIDALFAMDEVYFQHIATERKKREKRNG